MILEKKYQYVHSVEMGIIVSLISAPPNAASNSRPDGCRTALAKGSLVSLGLKGITVMLRMFGFDRRAVVPPKTRTFSQRVHLLTLQVYISTASDRPMSPALLTDSKGAWAKLGDRSLKVR